MNSIERPALLTRLFRTRLVDLLRLRVGDGLTVEQILDKVALEQETKQLIRNVVRRTRLRREEQCDVARELVGHFQDALTAGEPESSARNAFGEIKPSAKLIRRAKIRNRSLLWHAMNRTRQLAIGLTVVYVGAAVWLATGEPSVRVNYIAKLNASILATPEDDRAWPLYSKLLPTIQGVEKRLSRDEFNSLSFAWPGDADFPQVVAWTEENRETIEQLAAITQKPALGFVLGREGSWKYYIQTRANEDQLAKMTRPGQRADGLDEPLGSVMQPYVHELRTIANWFSRDFRAAVGAGERERAGVRFRNLLALSRQFGGSDDTVISQLAVISIRGLAFADLRNAIRRQPTLFSDADLREFAHLLGDESTPGDLFDLSVEKMQAYDQIQRIFTDDGNGDGRLSIQGLATLGVTEPYGTDALTVSVSSRLKLTALMPAIWAVSEDRAATIAELDRHMERLEAELRLPADRRAADRLRSTERQADPSALQSLRYAITRHFLVSFSHLPSRGDRFLAVRDATRIAIASELYRRRNGSFPDTLEQLVPGFLPTIPTDPADGKSLRYKLVEGKPLIYSAGTDGDDDGGVHPKFKNDGRPAEPRSLAVGEQPKPLLDGDWVIYPPTVWRPTD
jgi:hypothetical protein